MAWAWAREGSQTLTLAFLCFPLRIHSKEHFKEKYAMDDVQYTDEVSAVRLFLSMRLRASSPRLLWIPSPPTVAAWADVTGHHHPTASASAAPSLGESCWKRASGLPEEAPFPRGRHP